MKISHVTTRVLSTPADNPLVVGLPAPTDTREFVLLELGTDQGLVGIGLTFFGGALTPALRAAVEGLAHLAIGEDPSRTEAIVAKCRRAAGSAGPGGIFSLALAALDMACWRQKPIAGQTVHHSDHGTQYTSWAFGQRLRHAGLLGSMGTVGDVLDNALCESPIGLVKTEAIDDGGPTLTDRSAVEWQVADGSTSSIGYLSPVEFEKQHRQATETTPDTEVA